ncbi:MAG: protein-glutamate O-methyltransferase [Deltaproteobacteria bacterium]|nr:protein-glutamate O-methyltransferase [Deltaproteobacteria bacterium]
MNAKMSERDFRRLSEYIEAELGIKMPLAKKQLLESRLLKRLRALGLDTYGEYCDYLFSQEGQGKEIVTMIDLVTTNKTDFFREPDHFDYLFNTALPELVRSYGAGVRKTLVVWSAGCSTGEEPYTIAMVMSEFAERYPGFGFDFTILATDISTRVVETAARGVYGADRIAPIPEEMRRKYLLRSKDRQKGLFRVAPELRGRVRFRRLNFMDEDFGFREPLDVIFCRNVIIYFDKETQERLLQRFCENLRPGSFIFLGHSETLTGFDVPLERVAPSVYRRLE